MNLMGCNKKCFNNQNHNGFCEGLRGFCPDGKGGCKFQKEHRFDTKNYIPVKLRNGLTCFKEAESER